MSKLCWPLAVCGLALGIILAAGPAPARADEGLYAQLNAIGSFAETRDGRNDGSLGGEAGNRDQSDLVAGIGLAVGHQIAVPTGYLRPEVEFHYRFRYDFDRNRPAAADGFPNAGLDSNLETASLLFNLNYMLGYDFGLGLHPYFGGGIGATRFWAENDFNDIGGSGRSSDDTTGTNFTWAVNAGLLWDLSSSLYLSLGYRYIDLGEIDFGSFAGDQVNLRADYASHDILLGLGYRF